MTNRPSISPISPIITKIHFSMTGLWLPEIIAIMLLVPSPVPVYGQDSPALVTPADSAHVGVIEFDIPPQRLASALQAFAEAANLQVSY